MPTVVGALGTIFIELMKGQENLEIIVRAETIQISALFRSDRILSRVLET